jgi:hypothetical protein
MIRPLAKAAAFVASLFKGARNGGKRTYTTPLAAIKEAVRGPSLYGIGKASQRLRRARRQVIACSFTRLLARKPIGIEAAGDLGASWRKELAGFQRRWAKAGAGTVRLGRRAEKRAARLKRRREIAVMKRARREMRAVVR